MSKQKVSIVSRIGVLIVGLLAIRGCLGLFSTPQANNGAISTVAETVASPAPSTVSGTKQVEVVFDKELDLISETTPVTVPYPQQAISENQPKAPGSNLKETLTVAVSPSQIPSSSLDSNQTKVEPKTSEVVVAPPTVAQQTPTTREWKSKDGKFKTNAVLEGFEGGKVRIKKLDGRTAEVAIEKLSVEDNDYLKDMIRVDPESTVILGKVVNIGLVNRLNVVDVEGKSIVIELDGIALPENPIPDSNPATFLSVNVLDKQCWFETRATVGTTLRAIVYCEGVNINAKMLAEGIGRYKPAVRIDKRLENAEQIAKANKRGVWGFAVGF